MSLLFYRWQEELDFHISIIHIYVVACASSLEFNGRSSVQFNWFLQIDLLLVFILCVYELGQ